MSDVPMKDLTKSSGGFVVTGVDGHKTKPKRTTPKSKRPRGSGSVYRMGRIWWVQFYNSDGKRVRMSSKSEDPNVAEKLLRKELGRVAAGIDTDHRALRYESLRAAYLRERMARKNKSLPRKPDGSFILGDDSLPVFNPVTRLDSFFEGMKARSITTDKINEFIAEQQNLKYEPGTINRSLTCLRRMFSIAIRDKRLRDAPYFPMLSESNVRSGFFELGDYRKLLAALPNHLKAVLALGFWCGLRIGEIRSLRWEQINLIEKEICLERAQVKNDEARTVPLSGELHALLEAQRKACPEGFEYVAYQLDKNGKAVRLGLFVRTWRKACVKVGLGTMNGEAYSGAIFHDLRRTGVRNLRRAGVPESVCMRISGHKTASIFRRYDIVDGKDLLDAGRKLENYIRELGHKTAIIEESTEEKPQLTQ